MKLKSKLALGVLLLSAVLSSSSTYADEINKESIEKQIEAVTKSNYSEIDKISSLLDLYDAQLSEQHSVQDYITTLKVEVENKEANIKKLETEIAANNDKIANLDEDIKAKEAEIASKQVEIDKTQARIDKKVEEVKQLEEKLDDKRKRVAEFYRAVQIEDAAGSNSILKVLLDAEGVTDLINRSVGLTKVQTAANDLVTDLREEVAKQEKVKETIDAEKQVLNKQKQALDDIKKGIESAKKQTQVDSDKKKQKQATIDKEKTSLDKKIKDSEVVIKEAEENAKAVEAQFSLLTDKLVEYQADIQSMIDKSTDKKHKEILSDVYKRIEAIKPVEVATPTSNATMGKTWSYDTSSLDKARQKLVEVAKTQLGVPYVWGGTAWNSGLDCSGLTMGIYREALGIDILRVTTQQETVGRQVSKEDLKTGDLLFWGPVGGTTHVAMYIGNGVYIHAPQPGENVTYSKWGIDTASTIRRIIE